MKSMIDEIIVFWFGKLDEWGIPDQDHRGMWFNATRMLDKQIESRFGLLLGQAKKGQLHHWAKTGRGLLATILLLDQFSRNIFRGQAQAFAADQLALAIGRAGVRQGLDQQLLPIQRVFFYMPLEHAESLAAQEQSVYLFNCLERQVDEPVRPLFAEFSESARQHRDIIARFGRFPHRNKVLGRDSSSGEEAYLEQGGKAFGQS